ncbi:enoyl-CoA hydratase/isomerase family protein [Bacillus taeanensis]|uniref:Enoyl-CoA hydratase/isomerase family protein n=1 Tax=Bacillus taeanensis TaxID=273032 RepID=A0A366XUX0_9BACI|nr:enoyl-CoA hydratase-related protein [Bacillus taeanensis]RBW68569.1 enoyl-CoA hydratase/isomerase family protein [Bacillus taeanensis]
MFEHIKTEIANHVGTIIIDRQEVRNALNQAAIKDLNAALDELDSIPDLRVIMIKGAGEKAFVGGADIKELHEKSTLEALAPGMQGIYKKIEQLTKVTVAVINGHALGGGLELALACDIRIAAAHAKMGLPELNLAIIPGAGGTQRLSRMIGKGRALDMILTGKIIDGVEAERIGLVTQAVEGHKLAEAADDIVKSILSKGTLAVQLAKMVVNKGADVDLDTGLMLEKLAQTVAFASEEKEEGTRAFLEKRKPSYNKC